MHKATRQTHEQYGINVHSLIATATNDAAAKDVLFNFILDLIETNLHIQQEARDYKNIAVTAIDQTTQAQEIAQINKETAEAWQATAEEWQQVAAEWKHVAHSHSQIHTSNDHWTTMS